MVSLMTDQILGTGFTVQILNRSKASHFNVIDPKEINILIIKTGKFSSKAYVWKCLAESS